MSRDGIGKSGRTPKVFIHPAADVTTLSGAGTKSEDPNTLQRLLSIYHKIQRQYQEQKRRQKIRTHSRSQLFSPNRFHNTESGKDGFRRSDYAADILHHLQQDPATLSGAGTEPEDQNILLQLLPSYH